MEFIYDKDKDEKYKNEIDKVNSRGDGSKGVLTKKREIENYIPKELVEQEFNINLNVNNNEWDYYDVAKSEVKERLNGRVSKKITKDHLVQMNAWDEVEGWFKTVKEMVDKVGKDQ